jgi:hypothetical protein
MRKLILALGAAAGLSLSTTAAAAPMTCGLELGAQKSIICVCTTGTCDAPSQAPTKPVATPAATTALQLSAAINWVNVQICPATDATLSDGSSYEIWYYDAGKWALWASYTAITGPAANACVELAGDVPAAGFPIGRKRGWMLVRPNGAGATAVTIRLLASGPTGAL